jgi:hypothetical protein
MGKRCWVDLFDSSHFMGRMKRVFGPVEFKSVSARSMIVGPEARVEFFGSSNGRPIKVRLEPNRVVPDLAAKLRGARIRSAMVSCDLTVARGK